MKELAPNTYHFAEGTVSPGACFARWTINSARRLFSHDIAGETVKSSPSPKRFPGRHCDGRRTASGDEGKYPNREIRR